MNILGFESCQSKGLYVSGFRRTIVRLANTIPKLDICLTVARSEFEFPKDLVNVVYKIYKNLCVGHIDWPHYHLSPCCGGCM